MLEQATASSNVATSTTTATATPLHPCLCMTIFGVLFYSALSDHFGVGDFGVSPFLMLDQHAQVSIVMHESPIVASWCILFLWRILFCCYEPQPLLLLLLLLLSSRLLAPQLVSPPIDGD